MLSIFTSTMIFSIDHQSTSNDRLKPVMTTGLANMHIDRLIANLARFVESRLASHHFLLILINVLIRSLHSQIFSIISDCLMS